MSEVSEVTIATRFTRLNQLILGKSNGHLPKKYLAHRDSLLDVLFALYEECGSEQYRKNKHIASFVEKFKSIMMELRSLRLSLQDFEQKKIIGRGHFGEVFLVREKASGDVYAMKVLHKQETLSQQNVAFFEEERDIMAKSSSPWLTKLQYAFQDSQNLYLVMEFHPGGDMISLLEKYENILPDEMSVFYLAELVLAINSLHAMGYVHRDVKPANILMDRTGHIKLADFGSASKLNNQKQVISSMPVGTPDYVAPEVLTAMNGCSVSSKSYGVECDWWSLGIMAYEMVFGTTPFADEKVLVTYNNIMNFKNSLTFPPEESEVPKDLIDLIKNLLTEPMKRLGYDQLIVHPLFHDINWNDIHHIRPPFVPTVMSVDDTSNFDEFEPENRTYISEINRKKEFSGKNLPFVGFTYTSTLEAPHDKSGSSSADSSRVMSPTSSLTEVDSNLRRCKMASMEREIAHLVGLEKGLREELEKIGQGGGKEGREALLAENKRLEESVTRLNEEITHMKQILAFEHEHRVLTEKKAIHMVQCLKSKRRASSSRLIAKSKELNSSHDSDSMSLEEQLADAQTKVEELNIERADLIEDLHETKHMLLECQQKLKEQENLLSASIENTNASSSIVSVANASVNNPSENSCSIMSVEHQETQSKLVSKLEKKNIQLENELDSALRAKQEVERQVAALKATTENLEARLKQKESLQTFPTEHTEKVSKSSKKYQKELENKYIIIAEMQKKITDETQINAELKKKVQDFEKDLQLHIDAKNSMDAKFKELESKVSNMSKESEGENSNSEADQSEAKQISWVKKAQSSNERRESMLLTSDLRQESEYLKTKNDQLAEEIKKLKTELKEVHELKKQLREKESSVEEARLDLRAAQRKEEQSQSVASMLRERNKELREKLKESEEMVTSKTRIEDDLKEKVNALEDDISRLKDEITQIEKSREIEKAKLEERIKTLKDTWENSKDMNQKFAKTQGQYEEILRQNSELVKESDEKERKLNEYAQENKTLKAELSKRKEDCTKHMKVNGILKATCREMEEDLDDMKIIIEQRESVIGDLTSDVKIFQGEVKDLEEQLRKATKSVESFETQKQELLDHIGQLSEELGEQSGLHEAEVHELGEELAHFKRLVNELEVQASRLQRQLEDRDGDAQGQAGRAAALEDQLCHIKEEAARHITQISSLKTSNLKLTQELEEALENQRAAQRSIDEVYNELESEKAKHNHEKVKLKETISQQTKLIDFLQSKTENMEKKRKPMQRLFGKKENVPPSQSSRDSEKLLETERSRCRRLQDQLSQARVEREMMRKEISALKKSASSSGGGSTVAEIPVSPASRAMHCALTASPTEQRLKSLHLKPPGMKHRIPHRFAEAMCMRSTKCCACLDSIHFGRQLERCQECSIMCHPKCATSLPSTCGLPSEYMKHFKNAVQDGTAGSSSDSGAGKSEGWIKVPKPNKQGWDRRYLRLSNSVLYLFEDGDQQDEEKALAKFDFGSKAKMVVTSAVSATELPNVATSDLPYVLKIELLPLPRTTCWPQRSMYIMASNFNDKQMWVSVLEQLSEKNAPVAEEEEPQKTKLVGKTLWTLKSERLIDPLCTAVFDQNVILMGAVEGLYVLNIVSKFSFSLREKLEGFSHVYQIKCMRNIGMAVLIHGEDRKLSLARLSAIQSNLYKKQGGSGVPLKEVGGVSDCHLFAATEEGSAPYLCVAITDGVVVCQWEDEDFVPKKRIRTKEPCSCILFTPQSVIFGADMFYELTLGDFNAKMFLDENDSSLAGLVYGALRFESFPVAIFLVSPEDQKREYIICFHEMGVFVNSEGRRTRTEDMKWSRLPLSFAYQSPYLFITHFTSVEVIEIPPQNVSEQGNRALLRLKNPHFMGVGHLPKSILVSSTLSGQAVELISVDGTSIGQTDFDQTVTSDELLTEESISSGKESIGNGEADELDFSFTTEDNEDAVSVTSTYYSSESMTS